MKAMQRRWPMAAGVVAVALGISAGELVAGALSPSVSPLTAVGGATIDAMPGWVKEWAVSSFGTSDKLVFIIGVCVVAAVFAALAGVIEVRRRGLGMLILAVFAVVGLAAVSTRTDATAGAYAGPVVAGMVGAIFLSWFRTKYLLWEQSGQTTAVASAEGRRRFLKLMAISAGSAVVAATVATLVRTTAGAVASAREKLRLPTPSSAAPAIPTGASLNVPGISPLVTPAETFYRIDTALVVPSVNPDSWRLKVTGMVEREVEIDLATLYSKPLIERYITIACVSNEVGGDLIGNAKWLGWPIRELLAMAGVKSGADMVLSTSTDGFTAGTPLEAMTDSRDAMIAVAMNDQVLPLEHGFPARLIVPGLYGYVSATKWVTTLKVTTFAKDVGYWTPRGWSDHGPIKLSSRIDTPRDGKNVTAGKVQFGGVAWAQEVGISKVQVRVNQGPWQDATLATGISKDTWYQWAAEVDLPRGDVKVEVRAFDAKGTAQLEQKADVAPNGATGYHMISLHAG